MIDWRQTGTPVTPHAHENAHRNARPSANPSGWPAADGAGIGTSAGAGGVPRDAREPGEGRWAARILPGEEAMLVPVPRGPFGRSIVRALLAETVPDAEVGVAFRIPIDRHTFLTGWCEDSGILRGLPLNFLRWTPDGDAVVGPVVITRESRDEAGDLQALRPGDLERLLLVEVAGQRVLGLRVGAAA